MLSITKITRRPFFYQMVAVKENTLNLGQELGSGKFDPALQETYSGPNRKVLEGSEIECKKDSRDPYQVRSELVMWEYF